MILLFGGLLFVGFIISKILNSQREKQAFYAKQVFDQFELMDIYRSVCGAREESDVRVFDQGQESYRGQVIFALTKKFNASNLERLSKARRKDASVTAESSLLDMNSRAKEIANTVVDSLNLSKAQGREDVSSGRRRRRR